MEEADQKIADEVTAHSELMKNLEYLTTQIGARLTGSPQMQAASDWTLKRFKDYGIDAHLETAEIRAQLDAWTGNRRDHQPHSEAHRHSRVSVGARATSGDVSGQVMLLDVEKPSDLDQYKGKLKGKIVMLRKPADMSKLDPDPENAYDAVIAPRRGVPKPGINRRDGLKIFKQIGEEAARACRGGQRQDRQPVHHERLSSFVYPNEDSDGISDARGLRPAVSLDCRWARSR